MIDFIENSIKQRIMQLRAKKSEHALRLREAEASVVREREMMLVVDGALQDCLYWQEQMEAVKQRKAKVTHVANGNMANDGVGEGDMAGR